MKRTVKRIAPLQAGKILCLIYALMGLLFFPFFFLMGLAGAFLPHPQNTLNQPPPMLFGGVMLVFSLLAPIFYGLMGFIFGVVLSALYNFIARWVGGFEVEVE